MKKISTLFWFAALSAGTFSLQAAYSGVGTFNKIASASEITTGSYVFMANDQAMSNDFNKRFTAVALTYADGTKTSITDPDASIVFDIVADNGTLAITNGDRIVAYKGDGTEFTFNTGHAQDATLEQWTAADGSKGIIVKNVNTSTRYIMLRESSGTFGVYASSNENNSDYFTLTLFKKVDNGISPELAFENGKDRYKTFAEGYTFSSTASSKSASPIAYSSSNAAVATIDNSGTVTLKGVGETEIKAEVAANDTYEGAAVSYKLTVVNPSAELPYVTSFKNGLGDWLNYCVTGTLAWESHKNYGAQINGYNKGTSETWLVSPAVSNETVYLAFSAYTKYTGSDGTGLFLLYSTNFDPNAMDSPAEASWTEITDQANWPAEGSGETVASGTIMLSGLTAPVRVAFKYTCGEEASQWSLTDLILSNQTPGSVDETTLSGLKVISGQGEVVILSDQETEVAVYALTGAQVLRTTVEAGSTPIALPAGIYLVNGVKAIVF